MSRKRMSFLILPGLLMLASAGAWAQSVDDRIECVPEQPALMHVQPEVGTAGKDYTVPRKQVLLELFGRPT
jgi:hypothetical protein